MAIDSSIYFQQKPADPFGSLAQGVQTGMSFRDAIDKRKLQDQALTEQNALKTAMQKGLVKNPDGSVALDSGSALSSLVDSGNATPTAVSTITSASEAQSKARQEKIKSTTDFLSRASDVIKADPTQYQPILAQAKQAGYDVSAFPPEYGPEAQQKLDFYHGMGLSVMEKMGLENKDREYNLEVKKTNASITANKQKAQELGDQKSNAELMRMQQMAQRTQGQPAVKQAELDNYAADKFDHLFNLDGDPNNLNPQMVKLAAAEIGKMAQGGVPTVDELKGLNPANIPKGLAEAAQYFTASPTPANQGKLLAEYQKYSNSLREGAQKTIEENYGRVFNPYQGKYKDNPIYQGYRDEYIDRFKKKGPPAAAVPAPPSAPMNFEHMSDDDLAAAYKKAGGK